jgi:hypothetical protein
MKKFTYLGETLEALIHMVSQGWFERPTFPLGGPDTQHQIMSL